MGRRLAATVVLPDPTTGTPVVFEAGSEPAAWAADLITNPKAWDTAQPVSHADGDDAAADEAPATPTDAMPPKSGKGSGVEAWRAYADAHGVTLPEDATKKNIIAAVESAAVNN